MTEDNPWSRLIQSPGVSIAEIQAKMQDIELKYRDQLIEMSKTIALLESRLNDLEGMIRLNKISQDEAIDNVFSLFSLEDLGIERPVMSEEEIALDRENDNVRRVDGGFVAPPPEPVGLVEDNQNDPTLVQKDFDESDLLVEDCVETINLWIEENGAILNNLVSRKILGAIDMDNKTKAALKLRLKEGELPFKRHRVDKFRVLFHKGVNPDEEYEKAYG